MSWKDYYTAITGQKAPSEQASPSGTIYGTTPSRTSAVEDYYNEQMQQKQATEKARDIIDGRGRGHVGGLRDAWLDKHGEAESKTVDSRGHNSALRNEYQRQHPNVPTMSNALTDDEKFQLQSAYADAANKYKDASKKAQSIRPEEGLDYAATLEKYRSEQQAATKEKAAAESEMDRLRKQLEFYKVELPNVDQNVFERLWGSVKGGSKQAAGSLGGLFGYTGRVATGGQSAVDKALKASGNEELSALYHVGTEEEDEKAMQMQQAIADKSAELSESGGRDIERSKWGASGAGKFALDAVSQVPALAADMAANAILPGSGMAMMMGRSFGGGVQHAEAGGGNLAQAGAYGAASAAKEYLTEKMFGGLDLAYGKGFADTAVEKLVGKLAKTDIGRTVLRTIINGGGGEFVEEFVSSAVDPTLRAIYNGKSIGENYSEEQVSDWLYDGLVGAALGIAGSGVSIATGDDAKKNAKLRSGEVDKAFELMTGKKAASESQSAAEAQGDITTPPTPSNDAVAHPVELNSTINNVETQNADTQKNNASNGTERRPMSMEDYADSNSPVWNNLAYDDTASQQKAMKEAHDRMVAEGKVVEVPESTMQKTAESFPDLRGMKKAERTPILKQKMSEVKASLRQFLSGLKGGNFEFEVNGNVLEAKLYDTGIKEVLEKITQDKANMLSQSDQIFRNAEYLYSLPDYDGDSNIYRWNYFYTPVKIGNSTVGVRIAVRDMAKQRESQIYNWGIKKAPTLDGAGDGVSRKPGDVSSVGGVDASLDGARRLPNGSIPGGVSSDASEVSTSDNSIPTAEQNVNRGQAENSGDTDSEKTAKEQVRDAALEKAKADYQETVKRWYEQHPEADSIPVTSSLYNANVWIKGRVKAILQKYYDAEDFNEYVAGANEMAEKTYNMEENAEKNNRDAFSAAILDSKLKSEAKTEGGYTDENLLDDTYKAEKEAFSSREEPADKSVGTRLPSEILEMLGNRKADIGVELEDQLRALEREGKNARRAYEKAVELNDAAGAEREMTRIKSLRESYKSARAKLREYQSGSMSETELAELAQELHKEKHAVKGSQEFWENIAAKEAEVKAKAEKNLAQRRLQNSSDNGAAESANSKNEALNTARSMFDEWAGFEEIFKATGLLVFNDGSVLDPDTGKVLYRPGSGESDADYFAKSTLKSGSTAGAANNADASNTDFRADERDNARSTDATQDGSNTQDANSNYNADNTNHSTGSNTAERVYVDENGNEYDPKTGYTTRTAEEVQAERDAHISDDLYYTLRAEDRLTPDNAKEWAQWQRRREERQNAQKAPVPDETAWRDAEAEFGGANHDAIHKATQRAEEFETFLESDAFTSRLTDEQYTKVSDSVTEFKNKLAGLGDGHTSFAEFAEYYKAMKDSRILGDLYSERVNEQVQLARELAEEAYSNPIPYNVEKYRHAAVKAAQMTSHYIEKASKVRTELDELNNAVRENGSKRKPSELGREVERGEKGKSLREKAAAKFIRWQIMPRQMFQMIDGFKFWEKGAGYRMADTIENAAVKNQTTLVEANNFFADVVKMKGYSDFATGKTKTSVRLGGETLTMSEAVSLYKAIKTMGGPDAYRVQNIEGFALKNGDKKPHMIKADPANISELYSALQTVIAKNEVASAYVKAFDSMSEKLGKETQDIAKAIDGVDNELFKSGDYFPLTYARVEDGNFEWDKADSKDFGVPDFKNLKERTRTAGGYVNIAPVVEITDGYIRRAADYIAFGELADTFGMMDYMHTFGMSTLTDTVNREMGSEYGSWMRNYVNDVQDLNQTRAKSKDNFWGALNRNFQTAVLAGNPGTPFKQKGSMWLAMSELDPRAVAKAAVTSLNPGNQQMKAARDNPLLQFRAMGNIDSSITDALQDQNTLFGKMAAKSKVLKNIQNWIPKADVREVSKIYLASCYDVQMKNPGINANSAEFRQKVDETFQRASMRTQSQYTMNMRDEISRGDNDLLKSLTMFQTQQRTNFNNLMTAFGEAKAAKGTEHASKANKANARAIGGFVASNIAYGAMSVVADGLRHKLKQYRDDDEEQQIDPAKIAIKVGESFLEGVGGTVIFGDTATNFITSLFGDEPFYENGVGAVGAINDAMSAAIKLVDNPSADNVRKTAGGIANLLGIPVNNAYTLLNSFGMYTADIISAMSRSKESGNILNELLKGTSAADIAGKKKAGLYSISDDPADDFLKILDSIRKAVDKLAPDEFIYTDENGDEVSYELTKADKEQYRKDAEASYNSGMDALLKAFGYDKLDDKAKEDVEKQIKGYAKDAAEQGYLDSKGLDYDTGAPAWAEAVPKEDVPGYFVSKKILDADGKKTDYDAIDYLIGGFSKIPSSVQTQLKGDGMNVNALLYAKLFGIGSEAWYSNKGATKDVEESLGSSDVAKAIAVYNNMEGKSDEQILNAIKTQVLPDAGGKQSATVRRIEAYNTIAGNDADLGSWLDLAAALKDADVNGSVSKDDVYTAWANMGLSARETYAGITRSDFYNIVKSGVKSYAVNEDYATQVDEGYASIVPAKEEANPTFSGSVRNHQADDSTIKSTSIFTMEDYYRAIGLLK